MALRMGPVVSLDRPLRVYPNKLWDDGLRILEPGALSRVAIRGRNRIPQASVLERSEDVLPLWILNYRLRMLG